MASLKRELRRLGQQVRALPATMFSYFLAARAYDRIHAPQIRITQGQKPATDRYAIYLIYPAAGLQGSHIAALDWLAAHGVAPLVVSNLPLDADQVARLAPHCWQVLERPNVGYDFGGYRDGVLHLAPLLQRAQQLLLLNDSTWFPLPGSRDWLDDVAATARDFVGAMPNGMVTRAKAPDFLQQVWDYDTTRKGAYYASYALALAPPVLKNPAFLRFWKTFPMTGSKSKTVRRGEIGLSQWVRRHGHSHGCTFDAATLDAQLDGLSDPGMVAAAQRVITMDNTPLIDAKARMFSDGQAPDRATARAFLLWAAARQGISYALQDHTIRRAGFPFLKKSPLWVGADGRDITLRIAADLDGAPGRQISAEAQAIVAARAAPQD